MRAAAIALVAVVATGCGGARDESGLDSLTRVVIENVSPKATPQDLERSVEVLRDRLDKLRVPDPYIARDGEQIEIIFPSGAVDISLLLRPARLEFFDLQGDLVERVSLDSQGFPIALSKPPKERPKTVVVTCAPPVPYCPGLEEEPTAPSYYLFRDDPDLTGEDIKLEGTRQDFDQSGPIVLIEFTSAGAKKFHDVTRTLAARGRVRANQYGWSGPERDQANQQFAIVLDRELKSAPSVDFDENPAGIPGDNGAQITGIGPLSEARELALVLQTGALPLDFRVVSKETRTRD